MPDLIDDIGRWSEARWEDLPRRVRVDCFTPAERAIFEAEKIVNAMGPDERITKAVALLVDARHAVADYVDGGNSA